MSRLMCLIDVCIANYRVVPARAWKFGLPLEALRALVMQASIIDMPHFRQSWTRSTITSPSSLRKQAAVSRSSSRSSTSHSGQSTQTAWR